MRQQHRPQRDAGRSLPYSRESENRGHGCIVKQHRRDQSFCRAAGRILPRKPARHAGRKAARATRLTVMRNPP
jgi:hypothetical protein